MRVICIDTIADCYHSSGRKGEMPPVYIGNEYTVIDIVTRFVFNRTWVLYELEEIKPSPITCYYASDLFAEISDVDGVELLNTKAECI